MAAIKTRRAVPLRAFMELKTLSLFPDTGCAAKARGRMRFTGYEKIATVTNLRIKVDVILTRSFSAVLQSPLHKRFENTIGTGHVTERDCLSCVRELLRGFSTVIILLDNHRVG